MPVTPEYADSVIGKGGENSFIYTDYPNHAKSLYGDQAVSLIEEMPLMILPFAVGLVSRISVPSASGLKVFFTG
jgi:hypothetical protein